jgi:NAD(P)-dependent dehydrogenase (short-subunit alcohol dehydrogenase family)
MQGEDEGEVAMTESRVIVLTGVTRGLGRALVPHFAAAGHTVAGCGRSADHVAELTRQYGLPHLFAAVDVTDAAALERWAKEVLAKLGPPDLLVNNAAVMNPLAPLWEIPAADFDRVIDVNVKGVVNAIRAFVPAMVKRKAGVIVNLSSGWGRSTSPEVAPYCASKYAVEGLTLAMAQELPKGMAAIPLNPGVIATDMLRSAWGADADHYPSPEQWAKRAAPFLLNLGAKDNGKSLSVS